MSTEDLEEVSLQVQGEEVVSGCCRKPLYFGSGVLLSRGEACAQWQLQSYLWKGPHPPTLLANTHLCYFETVVLLGFSCQDRWGR